MVKEVGRLKFFLSIISSGRAHNVEKMTGFFGDATWVVPEDQVEEYKEAGANAVADGGSLSSARNTALELAFAEKLICVQLDDDLSKMSLAIDGKAVDIEPREGLKELVQRLMLSDYTLAGVSPTANPYFISKNNSSNLFVIGSMMAVKPSAPRFDEDLKLKEDYAFTVEHILLSGGVQRCDDILPTFLHYTNEGGCKDVRTDELEKEACQILMDKYPDLIVPHRRRENEVSLNIKKNFRMQ